jgi:hypothetical protein
MIHLAHGTDAVRVAREALMRLQRSVKSNVSFHGSRTEIVLTILDIIVHPGRELLPEDVKANDSKNLFPLASKHMGVIIALEVDFLQVEDPSTKRSVTRFLAGSLEIFHSSRVTLKTLLTKF